MDELEFRKRVYANPRDIDQDTFDAARANPDYQKILDETLAFEESLCSLVESSESPAGLEQRLLAIPEQDQAALETVQESTSNVSPLRAKKQSFFQYYAMAASLVLAVGVVFSLSINGPPVANDSAMVAGLLDHLYHELDELDGVSNGEINETLGLAEVNSSMANAGTRLVSHNPSQGFDVKSAKPCEIIPAYKSAHLVLKGSQGAISVFVINNSPVDAEFSIRDDRFDGIVLPMEEGNIILVGEKNEDLSQYASQFSDNVEWII